MSTEFRGAARVMTTLAVTMCLTVGPARGGDAASVRPLAPGVQEQIDLAYLLADNDMYDGNLPTLFDALRPNIMATPLWKLRAGKPFEVKAFDNLYFIGTPFVGSWALDTPAGIVLWDALNNEHEARTILVPGLMKLGLDPARIRYLIVTHGHPDHYGGAKYIQDTYKPRVLMSRGDWEVLAQQPALWRGLIETPPPPAHDMDVSDGQRLTVGGSTITFYITPGHTPETLSCLIPVTYRGKPHLVAMWGGNGMPRTLEPAAGSGGLLAYREQLVRFTKRALETGVDAMVSTHPVVDGTHVRAPLMAGPELPEQNPWVIGRSTFLRVMVANIIALDAGIAEVRASGPLPPPALPPTNR